MKTLTKILVLISCIAATISLTACAGGEGAKSLTIAATATSAEPAPSSLMIAEMLREHADAAIFPGDAAVQVVSPSGVKTVDITPMRGIAVENSYAKRIPLIDAGILEVDTAVGELAAATDGLDVIGTLDQALEATKPGGTVLLVTSGLSTVAPLDLTQAGGWIANPQAIIDGTDAVNLPDATGKKIVYAGIGHAYPGSGQSSAGPAARKALETILVGLCVKSGAASCSALKGPTGSNAPTSTNTVPLVSFDQINTACVGEVSLSADLLFGWDDDVLNDTADAHLQPIVQSLSNCRGITVNATGYTADVDCDTTPTAVDETLAVSRATAVLNRLVQLGASSTAIGAASNGGHLIDNCPGGAYSEAYAVKNRTVILSVE